MGNQNHDYSDEDFKKLLREISKRFAIAGLVVIAAGLIIYALAYFLHGGAQ